MTHNLTLTITSLLTILLMTLHLASDTVHGRRFSRRDRQVQPSLLVRLDAARARRDWDVLPHPLGARTVELATGPAPVVEEPWNARRTAARISDSRRNIPSRLFA